MTVRTEAMRHDSGAFERHTEAQSQSQSQADRHHERKMVRNAFLVAAAIAIVLYLTLFVGCTPPNDPTPPPAVNVNVTQNIGSQNQTGGGETGGACAGITGTPSLTATSGTFQGGKGKVGEPLVLRVDGLTIPSSCAPRVSASATGACTAPTSLPQTVNQVFITPTAAGTCSIHVDVETKSAGLLVEITT